ncbi:MAG: BON domain-containing protein [Planctomycetia bacterium]|nr:BON domain-containing protein [Planctomycetia bacterium]
MKRRVACCIVCVSVVLASGTAFAQLGRQTTTGRTTGGFGQQQLGTQATTGFGQGSTSGVQQASQNVGSIMSAQDFGGAGGGNLLRAAVETQSAAAFGNAFGNQLGMGAFGMGGFGGMGQFGRGGFGQQGMFGNTSGNTNQQNQRGANLKIPMRIAFNLPTTAVMERATKFESRITNFPGLERAKGVVVKLDGRTAVLQGKVATSRERDLIERLAKLEGGISQVQNELEIVPGLLEESLPAPAR